MVASGVLTDDHSVLSHDLSHLPGSLQFMPFSSASLESVRTHVLLQTVRAQVHREQCRTLMWEGGGREEGNMMG